MAKKTIQIYILITLITQLLIGLHAAIYVTYLLSNNLSLFQVSVVNFFFMLAIFILEIPTGAIADLFGRKISFVLSNIVSGCGFLIYGMADTFLGFITAEVIIALGLALTSGAFKAWLVDSLNYYQWNGNLVHIFRLEGRATNIAHLIGGLSGAYLGINNLSMPFIITGFGFLVLAILSIILIKEQCFQYRKRKEMKLRKNINQIARDSINYGLKHHIVFLIIIVVVIFAFGFQTLNMYWQPWFRPHLGGNQYLGYIWAGVILFTMLGNEMVAIFTRKFRNIKKGYMVIGISVGLLIIAAAIPLFIVSLSAYFLHELMRGIFRPYTEAMLQKNIPSKIRATVDSFVSMMRTGGAGLGLILFGLIANSYGIGMSWIVSGLCILLFLPLALLINPSLGTRQSR